MRHNTALQVPLAARLLAHDLAKATNTQTDNVDGSVVQNSRETAEREMSNDIARLETSYGSWCPYCGTLKKTFVTPAIC